MRVGSSTQTFYQMTSGLRGALDTVQRQMSTGQKASSYGAMGLQTQNWLDFSAVESQATALIDGIGRQQTRLKMIDGMLTSMGKTLTTTRTLLSGGLTAFQAGQSTAQNALALMTDLLNTKNGDVPLFGGAALSGDVTISARAMIDGDGTQPGLRALINERVAAETGGGTLGRLTLASTATNVTLTEAGGAFGYRLKGAYSSQAGLTITQASAPTPSLTLGGSVALQAGDTITVTLGLPSGPDETITLTAGEADFPAGLLSGAKLADALNTRISALTPQLKSAAALRVAQDYFAGSMRRVSGTPAAATALGAATAVPWYLGQSSADPRQSVQVMVGEAQTVRAGAQANETVFGQLLAGIASVTVLMEDPALQNTEGQAAMKNRFMPTLEGGELAKVQTVFGLIQNQLSDAEGRHKAVKTIASNYLADTNRTDNTEAAAQLLTLQNQLQASYQAGANILKLSLVNYL